MADQGTKIVHLAREILEYERNPSSCDWAQEASPCKMISVKTACLTALAAAIGSASFTHYIDDMTRPITRYERFEIEALVFYTAREKATSQDVLREEIQRTLSIDNLQEYSAYDFRRIRNYLWKKLQG